MSKLLLASLCQTFESQSGTLTDVVRRKMFGCDAFFKGDAIFGLIWKTGRIGLKFDNPAKFDELMTIKGAAPWKAGNKTMSKWILVPKEFHDQKPILKKWIKQAHSEIQVKAARKKPPKK